jgi:hypothetical protein
MLLPTERPAWVVNVANEQEDEDYLECARCPLALGPSQRLCPVSEKCDVIRGRPLLDVASNLYSKLPQVGCLNPFRVPYKMQASLSLQCLT